MYLNATIYTPVGTFEGTLNAVSADTENLIKVRDHYQTGEAAWTYLVMFNGSREITLPADVLKNSVIVYAIEDFTHKT